MERSGGQTERWRERWRVSWKEIEREMEREREREREMEREGWREGEREEWSGRERERVPKITYFLFLLSLLLLLELQSVVYNFPGTFRLRVSSGSNLLKMYFLSMVPLVLLHWGWRWEFVRCSGCVWVCVCVSEGPKVSNVMHYSI